MTIAHQTRFQSASGELKSYDITILIGYATFAIVILIAIYLASLSSGIAHGDIASMTVFP
jgi:hypothetical protein